MPGNQSEACGRIEVQSVVVEVVSIHVPKTAGTSLRRTLEAAYGKEAVLLDYADDPADPCGQRILDPDNYRERVKREPLDGRVRVIHGHFHAAKYDHLPSVKRIAFLRDPVENLLSIYFYWKQLPPDASHGLFRYFWQSDLSVVDLARLPTFRRLYTQVYFGGFDLTSLDFIGFTETYAHDLRRLSSLLDRPLVECSDNLNPHPTYRDEVRALREEPGIITRLRDLLIEDIRFYERAKVIAHRRHADRLATGDATAA